MKYLVDLGQLVQVSAPTARDAFGLALLDAGLEEAAVERPVVYRLSEKQCPVEVIEVITGEEKRL
jgi:hypothetical protein